MEISLSSYTGWFGMGMGNHGSEKDVVFQKSLHYIPDSQLSGRPETTRYLRHQHVTWESIRCMNSMIVYFQCVINGSRDHSVPQHCSLGNRDGGQHLACKKSSSNVLHLLWRLQGDLAKPGVNSGNNRPFKNKNQKVKPALVIQNNTTFKQQ